MSSSSCLFFLPGEIEHYNIMKGKQYTLYSKIMLDYFGFKFRKRSTRSGDHGYATATQQNSRSAVKAVSPTQKRGKPKREKDDLEDLGGEGGTGHKKRQTVSKEHSYGTQRDSSPEPDQVCQNIKMCNLRNKIKM